MSVLPMSRDAKALRRLWSAEQGVALIEFAVSLPVLLMLGLGGIELANFAVAHLRTSQIALTTADNASRVRESIDEADVNELFLGSEIAGSSFKFKENGRITLSSLEVNPKGDGQWIRWQRCMGDKSYPPQYGRQGKGKNDRSLQAMGPPGRQIAALPGTAVMFVEAAYDYQPIVPNPFTSATTITYTAAFNVRERDSNAITNLSNRAAATC
jgi:hypothetical protein